MNARRLACTLLLFVAHAAYAQLSFPLGPRLGDQQFSCHELGGIGCSRSIPDVGPGTYATASFTIPADAPLCAYDGVQVVVSALHAGSGDLQFRVAHLESGASASFTESQAPLDAEDTMRILSDPSFATSGVAGTWTVEVEDAVPGDYGALLDVRVVLACRVPKVIVSESGTVAGQAEPGEQIGYTLELGNDDVRDALVDVVDPLPPGTSFVSADNGGALVGGEVRWNDVLVPGDGSVTLNVVVAVDDPLAAGLAVIPNQASTTAVFAQVPAPVVEASCDPAVAASCVSTDIPTIGALAAVPKTLVSESGSLPGFAEPGEQLGYALTLENTGGSDLTGVVVVDPLPVGTSFVSADQGGAPSGGDVVWNGLTVPAGGSLVLNLVVQVDDPLPAGLLAIANQATVNGAPTCADVSDPLICEPTEIPTAGALGPTLKTISAESGSVAGFAEPGETLTYTLTLRNFGGNGLSGVAVSDPLPAGTVFVSADNGGTLVGGAVEWAGLDVPAFGTRVLTVSIRVADPILPGTVEVANQALVDGVPSCADIAPGALCEPTRIPLLARLGPTLKTIATESGVTPGVAEAGETLSYAITLANPHGVALTGVAVADPLPVGTEFVSADNGGVLDVDTVRWTGLTVPANGSLTLTLSVRVVPLIPPGLAVIANQALANGIASCASLAPNAPCEPTRIAVQAAVALPVPVGGIGLGALLALLALAIAAAHLRRPARRGEP